MTKVHFTSRTLDDLQDIYDYSIEEWGEKTALKYMSSFEDAFRLVQENPNLLRINEKISSRFYIYNVRKHYLICDIINEEIYVITIKHISMNVLERLRDLEPLLDEEVKVLQKKLKE